MIKTYGLRFLCVLAVLLTRHVSGTFHPRASVAPATSRKASDPIGSKHARKLGTNTGVDSDCLASILGIRGGGFGSMVSDFNEYIGASKSRAWAVLVFSILTDTVSVTLMKMGQEESSMEKIVLSFVGFFLSLAGFGLALKSIDVSIAYAIWASVGTATVSVMGIAFFGESVSITKIICLAMILFGVVGLELSDGH